MIGYLIWLLGQYQFIVAGDSQSVGFSTMDNDDFILSLHQFGAGDALCRHGDVTPFRFRLKMLALSCANESHYQCADGKAPCWLLGWQISEIDNHCQQ
jgi:hypothetical protein